MTMCTKHQLVLDKSKIEEEEKEMNEYICVSYTKISVGI